MQWEAVIGLEVHAQLATKTKIFCGCPNQFGALPNTHVCPVCTGQPGALPVLNEQAVTYAITAALALNCNIHQTSIFARKQYFYPDLPKGYQISQYDRPYSEHGWIDIDVEGTTKRIGITRIHMEEDAGKNTHGEGLDPHSYVDYNRACSPLIEIVSEPDLRSPAEAGQYLRKLHSILRYIGVSDADMEKGNFRCDANVSVRPLGEKKLGTKAELKNLNSFRFVEKAIAYEIDRQIELITSGGKVVQETRLWDTTQNKSRPLRSKEEAHDYRYFPEPDLPPLVISDMLLETCRHNLPELPAAKKARFVTTFALPEYDAEVLTSDSAIANYFETTLTQTKADAKTVSNWIMNEVLRRLEGDIMSFPIQPDRLGPLLDLVIAGTISGSAAKQVFQKMLTVPTAPQIIVTEEGLLQVSDNDALAAIVADVLAKNPDELTRLRAGEQKLMGFFMGEIMKASKGKANPAAVKEIMLKQLSS